MLLNGEEATLRQGDSCFNGHPPLGVNATSASDCDLYEESGRVLFQWAPTLGGECYDLYFPQLNVALVVFQWAPTLGGECYKLSLNMNTTPTLYISFNGHPPLGVNATPRTISDREMPLLRFNGHPPLGVNATDWEYPFYGMLLLTEFQWAPTLGGECYTSAARRVWLRCICAKVSMGTHPWG